MKKRKKKVTGGNSSPGLPIIGWREWIALPDLGLDAIHAKIDTGATTSALHADVREIVSRGGMQIVRFAVQSDARNRSVSDVVEAELLEYRRVKSSSGHYSRRPVVFTHVKLGLYVWPIELTLANRETMGMPMLLGRQSLKRRFLVDPAHSYLLSKRPAPHPPSSTDHH